MSTEADRRIQAAQRIPFDALVEVGGASGPSFEAQAINISEEGMQLRTAYLPNEGQPITCRFDAGPGQSVLASGEVVWAQQGGKGGEFGIRFTDMDPESIDSLRRMCGIGKDPLPQPPGSKVRLHIDGLASPMRARVKTSKNAALTVGSDLGFLQVGKELELEDAESGNRRLARIDGVEVEIDASSHVPQLIVMLRYADEAGMAASAAARASDGTALAAPEPEDIHVEDAAAEAAAGAPHNAHDGDLESVKRASGEMKGALARGVRTIGPAVSKFATRAKTTIALLAAKRHTAFADVQQRRTTAPAPGGGLHTAGRKVIRGESMSSIEEPTEMTPKLKPTKRRLAIGGAVLLAVTLLAVAMRKHPGPPTATADSASSSIANADPRHALANAPAATMAAPAFPLPVSAAPADSPMGEEPTPPMGAAEKKHVKPGKVTPFGNGPVAHGNILHLKMDGPIESIEGAQDPTGFTVHLPGRRAVEAAGPLAARDARIASVKVSNDPGGAGAELTLTFKDGVPHYQVRAKGDMLEIALAPIGKSVAKKDGKPAGGAAKHAIAKKKANNEPDPH